MKLENSTGWSDCYLQNMVRWCCARIGLQLKEVREAKFLKADHAKSGVARGRCIEVRVGDERYFPFKGQYHGVEHSGNDPAEGLVYVTSHELLHILQFVGKEGYVPAIHEPEAVNVGMGVMMMFRGRRQRLEAEWNSKPHRRKASRELTLHLSEERIQEKVDNALRRAEQILQRTRILARIHWR